MRKRYDLLAINFVNLNDKYHNNKEVEIFLRSRTKKIVED
jgi:hypothetical protein